MNEAQTEFEYIDPALREADWGVVEGSRIFKQFPITNKEKPGVRNYSQLRADYVLIYRNRNLAVIEAKKRDSFYTEGLGQAKDYFGEPQKVRFSKGIFRVVYRYY